MRISDAALIALLALTACQRPAEVGNDMAPAKATIATRAGNRIDCARGDAAFARDCTVEREKGQRGVSLTLRHDDGAFRRLLITGDGRGVIAADGAERARVTVIGPAQIEVAIGGDRYRLPATIRGTKPAAP